MVCRVLVKNAGLAAGSLTVIGVVCLKAASIGFGPSIRARAIAAARAGRRRTAGVAGATDKLTVPLNTADNDGGNKADGGVSSGSRFFGFRFGRHLNLGYFRGVCASEVILSTMVRAMSSTQLGKCHIIQP